MISFKHKGDFSKTFRYLKKAREALRLDILNKYGQKGVAALSTATPEDSGMTANSWGYKIEKSKNTTSIIFTNSNINEGVPIAIILQYGHATGNGGWVQGRDYINPVLQSLFDDMAEAVWREVTNI